MAIMLDYFCALGTPSCREIALFVSKDLRGEVFRQSGTWRKTSSQTFWLLGSIFGWIRAKQTAFFLLQQGGRL